MKVCPNCGARIYIDRSHCTVCGAPLEESGVGQNQPTQQVQQIQPNQQIQQNQQVQQNQQSRQTQRNERVTAYEGEIHKCPNCGETLPSFTANCPSCGYEIRGTTANVSIANFSSKLGEFQSDEERSNFIRYFPIPNSKEDIYEFLILASTNIGGSVGSSVSEAWAVKVEQCYQKAKLSFNNTDAMAQIQKTYDDIQGLLQNAKKEEKRKTIFRLIIRSAMSIIGIIIMIIAASVNMLGGNSILFEFLGYVLLICSAIVLSRHNCSLPDLGIGFISGVLTIALSFLLDTSYLGFMSGAAITIIIVIGFFNYISRNSKDTNQQTAAETTTSNTSDSSQSSTVTPLPTNSSSAVPTTTTPTPTVPTPTQSSNVPTPVSSAPNTSVSTISTPNAPNITLNINVPQSPTVISGSLPPARTQPVRSVKVPRSVKNGSETNYAVAEALFVQAGFTNVKTVPLNDLLLGILNTPGAIEKITIDGRELSTYFRRTFDSDVPVMITYHSRQI